MFGTLPMLEKIKPQCLTNISTEKRPFRHHRTPSVFKKWGLYFYLKYRSAIFFGKNWRHGILEKCRYHKLSCSIMMGFTTAQSECVLDFLRSDMRLFCIEKQEIRFHVGRHNICKNVPLCRSRDILSAKVRNGFQQQQHCIGVSQESSFVLSLQ